LIRGCFGAAVLTAACLLCASAWGQAGTPNSIPAPAQTEAPKDALGRTTPRGTVLGFLSAARKGDDGAAAQYLNTRLRGQPAAELARQLYEVLNRRLPARLNELSDRPEGSLPFPAEPNIDLVGTISSDSGNVDILIERVDRKKAGFFWLFSRKTLDTIPELYAEVDTPSVENGFIKFLVETRIAHIPLSQWLGFFAGLPLAYLATGLLNRFLSRAVGHVRRRLRGKPELPNPEVFPGPVRLLVLALIVRWAVSTITLPLLARQFWSSTINVVTIAGCVWLAIRLNGWVEDYIRRRLGRQNQTGALSVLRFTRRASDLLAVFVGVLVIFRLFGMNPATALAGLGVGGIAIALAAQKTLENVIAGVSLISDKAFRVGDFLKVGETAGTVTAIGLRSTRIRTNDRTVVNVPNGQIATASLENISLRDQFWFHHILGLRYETTPSQIRSILEGINRLLAQHPGVDGASVRVRFVNFGASSLDVDIFAYFSARDWIHFLEIQEELLLQIMGTVQAAGAQRALPSQAMYLAGSEANGAVANGPRQSPKQAETAGDEAGVAKPMRRRRTSTVVPRAHPAAGSL